MDLDIFVASRHGLAPAGKVMFMAERDWQSGRWHSPWALWYQSPGRNMFGEGAFIFPVDPNFVRARVAEENCEFAGLAPQQHLPDYPWREVDWQGGMYPEANRHINHAPQCREDCDFVVLHYQCSRCGRTRQVDPASRDDHPITWVEMKRGFGFDPERRLFVPSGVPGKLMLLALPDRTGWLPWRELRLDLNYVDKQGLLPGWKPLFRGSMRGGRFPGYSFIVLAAE